MKKLKFLQRFFMLLFVGFAMCAVQACGDDEEDEPIQDPNEEEVVKPDDGEEEDEPSDKPTDTMEAVDLGLSVKWASCNVGAISPEEYGDYFAWGDTKPKSSYDFDNSTTYGFTKSELEARGIIDEDGNLTAVYDAATVNWGKVWRMPTMDEIVELLDKCTWEWITYKNVNGRLVTGPNGNSIFLPATGCQIGTDLLSAGSYGHYWSAMLDNSINCAFVLYFTSDRYDWHSGFRDYGYAVRPVLDER